MGSTRPDLDAHTLAVTYGYSRDHRADLKQWMLALATTRQGDVPLFCQALDGNASDKVSLVAAVEALADQLQTAGGGRGADLRGRQRPVQRRERCPPHGGRRALDQSGAGHLPGGAGSAEVADAAWQQEGDAVLGTSPPGAGRRTLGGRAHDPRRGAGPGDARAAGGADARAVGESALAPGQPALRLRARRPGRAHPAAQETAGVAHRRQPLIAHPKQTRPGRPRKDRTPDRTEWQIEATCGGR